MPEIARGMGEAIRYRGPDDSGVWVEEDYGIGFVHRRLSILDLSPEGHQPMFSRAGRYVIAYNGEVYNFGEIGAQLEQEGCLFRGHSDTEVILAAIENWGLEEALQRFVGMFAFALWDKADRKLYLVRDRLGIKPLYYGWTNESFVFGSELGAIKEFPGFEPEVDRDALALLMRHNYIPTPFSIYKGIRKLEPGCIVTLNEDGRLVTDIERYWSAKAIAQFGVSHRFQANDDQAIEHLDRLLGDAVGSHMVSDVPLGAFLSGGLDSSMVAAQMQSRSNRPIKTFSIGFFEEKYNEAHHAKIIARHLGTDHTELYVTPDDAMTVIPRLPHLFSEPFADSSQIPTLLVSELARQQVTVSLSGDGGDELFGGYERYQQGKRIWDRVSSVPKPLRRALAHGLCMLSPDDWNHLWERADRILPKRSSFSSPGHSLHKLSDVLTTTSPMTLYQQLMSHWTEPTDLVLNSDEKSSIFFNRSNLGELDNFFEQMMLTDLVSYLPDDILTKVDRVSMAASLEARVPLLDHRLVEFAWQLPLSMKIRNNQGKWIFRQVLQRYVPNSLIDRPKMGFALPVEDWLRNQLRDWAEAMLDETKLAAQGYFDVQMVRKKWTEYLGGQNRWYPHLWSVLMFQAWLEVH